MDRSFNQTGRSTSRSRFKPSSSCSETCSPGRAKVDVLQNGCNLCTKISLCFTKAEVPDAISAARYQKGQAKTTLDTTNENISTNSCDTQDRGTFSLTAVLDSATRRKIRAQGSEQPSTIPKLGPAQSVRVSSLRTTASRHHIPMKRTLPSV